MFFEEIAHSFAEERARFSGRRPNIVPRICIPPWAGGIFAPIFALRLRVCNTTLRQSEVHLSPCANTKLDVWRLRCGLQPRQECLAEPCSDACFVKLVALAVWVDEVQMPPYVPPAHPLANFAIWSNVDLDSHVELVKSS